MKKSLHSCLISSATFFSFLLGASNFAANGAQQSEFQTSIPDDKAYRLIFLVASTDVGASEIEVNRAKAVIDNIGFM